MRPPNLYKEYRGKKKFGNGGGCWEEDTFTFRNAMCLRATQVNTEDRLGRQDGDTPKS